MDRTAYTTPLPRRPWLRRDVPLLWRGEHRLQIGTDPQRLIIIDTTRSLVNWASTLRGDRTLAEALIAVPAHTSVESPETTVPGIADGAITQQRLRLLHLLHDVGAVADAAEMDYLRGSTSPDYREQLDRQSAALRHIYTDERATQALPQRRMATVAVHGRNRLSNLICDLLTEAGVGSVLRHASTSTSREGRHRSKGIDLHVLADSWHPDILDDLGSLASDVPHLYVAAWGRTAAIGPLVVPGVSSCLRCRHLHRRDADPLWPRLLVQLAHIRPEVEAIDAALLHLAGAHASVFTTGFLDAQARADRYEPLINRQRIVYAPEGLTMEETMPPHPLCGCRW